MAKQLKTEKSRDRISSLQDPILCHILSFLPTKYAVGTSVLSPRWRYLFTMLPNVDFDDLLVFNHNKSTRKLATTFSRFIARVSTSCKLSHMDKFSLKVHKKIKTSRIECSIRAALCRNVKEIDLYIYMNKFLALPQAVYTSKTLVVLKLHEKVLLNVPTSVCFPCLKILHLDFLEFQESNSLNRLISGCPILEDLFIEDCKWDYTHVFNISSTTLKSLTIYCKSEGERFTPENEDHHEFHIHKLNVDAPFLEVLKIYGDIAKEYSLKNLQSLDRASIDVMDHVNPYAIPVKFEDIVLGLVKGISHVKVLRLSLYDILSCKGFADSLPMFHNMTHLTLGGHNGLQWQALHNLLHSMPKLESLEFLNGIYFEFTEEELPQSSSEFVPSCFSFHLKTIEFGAFCGMTAELELVKYFLQNAKVLVKLLMRTVYITQEQELKARDEVLKLPKCSKMCEVLFYKYNF